MKKHHLKTKFGKRMVQLSALIVALFMFLIVGASTNSPIAASVAFLTMASMPQWAKFIPGFTVGILGSGAITTGEDEAKKAAEKIKNEFLSFVKESKFMTEDEAVKKFDLWINEKGLNLEKVPVILKDLQSLAEEVKAIKESGNKKTDNEPILKSVFNHIESLKLESKVGKSQKNAGYLAPMEIKAAALMTIPTHIIPEGTGDFSLNVNNFVDNNIYSVPKPDNFILPLVSVTTQKGTEKIWWSERNTEEGDAQFIGEGDLKPLISAKWETKSADMKEVAERWKMSDRMVMHTNRVVDDFREHANELIDQKIDTEVLQGDGTGDNLSGIFDVASAFVAPAELAGYYTNPNIYDVINAVATQVKLANFTPTVVVLNTVEKAKMLGLKDGEDRYLMPPFVTPSGNEISGIRVIFSNKMPAGKILLGDLKKFKVVFAEDVMYATGWENDDFSKNITSQKLEAFLGTYIPAPYVPAIVYDDIATVQTAIGSV